MKILISYLLLTFFPLYLIGQNYYSIGINESWKVVNNNDNNIVIAIIDNGILISHEDLSDNIWNNKPEISGNLIDDDNNGFIDDIIGWNFEKNSNDVSINGMGNWHGTPVNGIIGAVHNNYGVSGICPKVKLLNLVKDEGVKSIINSLRYILMMRTKYNITNGKEGAFIVAVNCSWGKDSLWGNDYKDWCALYDSLGNEGVLCVSSVPNDNINVDLYGDMPSTCISNFLITVTNVNQYDQKVEDAAFGNVSVDIGAPGENSYTILNTGGYGYFGGTSAAATYVTGAIGLLYSIKSVKFKEHLTQAPEEVATLVKSMIMEGVDKEPSLDGITVSGGRLNVFKSIKLLCDFYGEKNQYENIFSKLNILSIYPNPASSSFQLIIESDSEKNIEIKITNLYGQSKRIATNTLQEGIQKLSFDVTSFPTGVYIVSILYKGGMKSVKLTIQQNEL